MEIIIKVADRDVLLSPNPTGAGYQLSTKGRVKDKDTGEWVTKWTGFNWFSKLEYAITKLLDLKICASDASTLSSLQYEIKKAKDELSGLYDMS